MPASKARKRQDCGLSMSDILILHEYIGNGLNGIIAWQKYHPKSNDNSAKVNFNKLIKTSAADELIKSLVKKITEKCEVSGRRTMEEAAKVAYAPISGTVSIDQKISGLRELGKMQKLYDPDLPLPPNPTDGLPGGSKLTTIIELPDNKRGYDGK
jgi:hypothetical protein